MKCISALSTLTPTDSAQAEVLSRLAEDLDDQTADLVVVFASSHHAEALGSIAAHLRERGLSRHVLACTGESIIGEDQEIEGRPALSLWAIQLPGVTLTPRRITFADSTFSGWQPTESSSTSTLILLGDPFTFPTDQFLKQISEAAVGLRVVGGMASASQSPGENRLILDSEIFDSGAVAIEINGPVAIRTVVSQGCRPIGHSMIVTRSDRNIIRELGRRPALEVLREVFEVLDEDDQQRVQQGLHIGRVINEYQESFHRGDFLVRNVIGADDSGGLAITDAIRVGQTVQFHVRDARSADEDLRTLLKNERLARPRASLNGALLFTCNGRGARLFDAPNHDVATVHEIMGPVPLAGFFAMGEIGPIGGQNFVHGFTASIVLFETPEA